MAKNEIYARHGYIFKNENLYNYFIKYDKIVGDIYLKKENKDEK